MSNTQLGPASARAQARWPARWLIDRPSSSSSGPESSAFKVGRESGAAPSARDTGHSRQSEWPVSRFRRLGAGVRTGGATGRHLSAGRRSGVASARVREQLKAASRAELAARDTSMERGTPFSYFQYATLADNNRLLCALGVASVAAAAAAAAVSVTRRGGPSTFARDAGLATCVRGTRPALQTIGRPRLGHLRAPSLSGPLERHPAGRTSRLILESSLCGRLVCLFFATYFASSPSNLILWSPLQVGRRSASRPSVCPSVRSRSRSRSARQRQHQATAPARLSLKRHLTRSGPPKRPRPASGAKSHKPQAKSHKPQARSLALELVRDTRKF